MEDIRVEAIEDIRGFPSDGVSTVQNGRLIAKKGRQDLVEFGSDVKKLSEDCPYEYVDVLFDEGGAFQINH